MARALPFLLALLMLGCNAALKERNNELETQLDDLQTQVRAGEDRVHELEHELDTCQAAVERKAVTELVDEAGIDPERPLYADLVTSEGRIRIQLFPAVAPRTVAATKT